MARVDVVPRMAQLTPQIVTDMPIKPIQYDKTNDLLMREFLLASGMMKSLQASYVENIAVVGKKRPSPVFQTATTVISVHEQPPKKKQIYIQKPQHKEHTGDSWTEASDDACKFAISEATSNNNRQAEGKRRIGREEILERVRRANAILDLNPDSTV